MSVLFQALYRFFGNMTEPLNKTEKDQPAPLDMQREHLIAELAKVEREIKRRREYLSE